MKVKAAGQALTNAVFEQSTGLGKKSVTPSSNNCTPLFL